MLHVRVRGGGGLWALVSYMEGALRSHQVCSLQEGSCLRSHDHKSVLLLFVLFRVERWLLVIWTMHVGQEHVLLIDHIRHHSLSCHQREKRCVHYVNFNHLCGSIYRSI